jgi:RimJ/RimL family protein N-acetyltransferase
MSMAEPSGGPAPGPIRTPRLLLRCWRRGDALLLKGAVDDSLPELQRWMPWAATEPSPLKSFQERIEKFRRAFAEGREWTYGVFDPDETRVLGGAGLHSRSEPGRLEIGYWIRSGETGKGLATEVAAALADRAFALHGVEAVEIRCDPRNDASAAVPRRLGFRHTRTLAGDDTGPDGAPRDTMVWVLERTGSRAGAEASLPDVK